jgi:hypothetical protein
MGPKASAAMTAGLCLAALLAAGCLDVSGCYGTATWTEPGLTAWLANGTRPGFSRLDLVPGVDPGPAVAARIPEGSHLQYASYKPGQHGSVERQVLVSPGMVEVSAFTLRPGVDAPDARSMADLLDGVLRAVHAGGNGTREAAVDALLRDWPQHKDGDPWTGHLWWTNVSLDGPWELGRAVAPDAAFVRDANVSGGSFLRSAGWELAAAEPDWIALWRYRPQDPSNDVWHRMEVDAHDRVVFDVELKDTGEDVKDILRGDPRGVSWTFQGFGYWTTCKPGPWF